MKWAVLAALIVNSLVFVTKSQSIELVLGFTEICFVGLIYEKKHKYMAFYDALYWVIIGGAIICSMLYTTQGKVGIDAYSLIFIYLINGIFNITLAEVATTYAPFKNLYGFEVVIQKPPTIVVFLIHLCIAGILGPFMLYMVFNSWNFEKEVKNKVFENSKQAANYINDQFSHWSSADRRALKLKSLLQIGYVNDIIKAGTIASTMNIQLLDSKNEVLASNFSKDKNNTFDLLSNWKKQRISDNFYIWLPDKNYYLDISSKWDRAFYLYESSMFDFKILVKVPIIDYRDELFTNYLLQARIIMIFSILIAFLILIIKNFIVRSLSLLLNTSTNLPEKLKRQQGIFWPESSIFEVSILTNNFKAMSEELGNMIMEYKSMYNSLENKTNQLIDSEKRLHEMAYYDALTGLPNRHYFTNNLKFLFEEMAKDNKTTVDVMLIDLDRFKQVNDTHGHLAGDLLLKIVSERLIDILNYYPKDNHFVSRMGGDEFVVVINDLNESETKLLAQSIITELKKPIKLEARGVFIGASIGISVYPYNGDNMVEIMKNADKAMYAAKESGGNQYRFYSSINNVGISQKMCLEQDIYKAFERKD
ncbi:MAG: GGDEF domain-containing protein [Bacillota bacterium]|nr:GGDEF domain-containing protein [Bacillota bacterium]